MEHIAEGSDTPAGRFFDLFTQAVISEPARSC